MSHIMFLPPPPIPPPSTFLKAMEEYSQVRINKRQMQLRVWIPTEGNELWVLLKWVLFGMYCFLNWVVGTQVFLVYLLKYFIIHCYICKKT